MMIVYREVEFEEFQLWHDILTGDECSIKNDEFYIENDGFCVKNHELWHDVLTGKVKEQLLITHHGEHTSAHSTALSSVNEGKANRTSFPTGTDVMGARFKPGMATFSREQISVEFCIINHIRIFSGAGTGSLLERMFELGDKYSKNIEKR